VLQDYIHAVEDAEKRIGRLVEQIEQLLPDWSMAGVVKAIQAMRGVAFINAVTIVAEIGDFTRFCNPRQLMAYAASCRRSIPAAIVCDGVASPKPAIARLIGR